MSSRGPSETSDTPVADTPVFIYGTGSDSPEQHAHVYAAITRGYRMIDTGPTPAYNEPLVAEGLRKALSEANTAPIQPWIIQTKISPVDRYQKTDSISFDRFDQPEIQVFKSFEKSKNLFRSSGGVIKILLLHAPFPEFKTTLRHWRAMERLTEIDADLEFLGICNVGLGTLQKLYAAARVKPSVVQNSFRGPSLFDGKVVQFCRERHMVYQAYSVLISNIELLSSNLIGWFAETYEISEAQALFLFVIAHGRGTIRIVHASRDVERMASNLQSLKHLSEIQADMLEAFEDLLGKMITSSTGQSWSY